MIKKIKILTITTIIGISGGSFAGFLAPGEVPNDYQWGKVQFPSTSVEECPITTNNRFKTKGLMECIEDNSDEGKVPYIYDLGNGFQFGLYYYPKGSESPTNLMIWNFSTDCTSLGDDCHYLNYTSPNDGDPGDGDGDNLYNGREIKIISIYQSGN